MQPSASLGLLLVSETFGTSSGGARNGSCGASDGNGDDYSCGSSGEATSGVGGGVGRGGSGGSEGRAVMVAAALRSFAPRLTPGSLVVLPTAAPIAAPTAAPGAKLTVTRRAGGLSGGGSCGSGDDGGGDNDSGGVGGGRIRTCGASTVGGGGVGGGVLALWSEVAVASGMPWRVVAVGPRIVIVAVTAGITAGFTAGVLNGAARQAPTGGGGLAAPAHFTEHVTKTEHAPERAVGSQAFAVDPSRFRTVPGPRAKRQTPRPQPSVASTGPPFLAEAHAPASGRAVEQARAQAREPSASTPKHAGATTLTVLPVYLINLSRRPDRLAHFMRQWDRELAADDEAGNKDVAQFELRVFTAIDGQAHAFSDWERSLFARSDFRGCVDTSKRGRFSASIIRFACSTVVLCLSAVPKIVPRLPLPPSPYVASAPVPGGPTSGPWPPTSSPTPPSSRILPATTGFPTERACTRTRKQAKAVKRAAVAPPPPAQRRHRRRCDRCRRLRLRSWSRTTRCCAGASSRGCAPSRPPWRSCLRSTPMSTTTTTPPPRQQQRPSPRNTCTVRVVARRSRGRGTRRRSWCTWGSRRWALECAEKHWQPFMY